MAGTGSGRILSGKTDYGDRDAGKWELVCSVQRTARRQWDWRGADNKENSKR